jgi:hypothetical protein
MLEGLDEEGRLGSRAQYIRTSKDFAHLIFVEHV